MITKTHRRILTSPAFLSPLVHASLSFAEKVIVTAKVMKVTDGDTVVVSLVQGGAFLKCRLYGLDAPEVNPPLVSGVTEECLQKGKYNPFLTPPDA
jgi:endonuclease YncB( thermonuclease family)